mmetsp:Transcript_69316/g.206415  ORF Transcript_69316/g.206415 Transcript_69316/m.206415 type:complete len:227 (-) Transcript_69316:76-756(-)
MLRSRSRSPQRHRRRDREAGQGGYRRRHRSGAKGDDAPPTPVAAAERPVSADRSATGNGTGPASAGNTGASQDEERPPLALLPMYDENGWLRPGFAPPPPPPGTPPLPSSPPSPPSPGAELPAGACAPALALREAAAAASAFSPAAEMAKGVVPPRDLSGLTGAALARMGLIPRGTGPSGSTTPGFNSKGFPMRPGMPMCSYYTRTGNCAYGVSCKWDHPERGLGR